MTSFRFSFMKSILLLMLLMLPSMFIMSTSFAAANPTYTSALWVAEDNGVLKVTASDGNILFEIANIGRVDAVVTDGERGRLWVATQAAIYIYNFAGEVIFSKPSPFTVNTQEADDIMMVINEAEGSVWLTNEVELIKLDSTANVVIQQTYIDEVETISFDSINNRVWLAHDDTVSSIDATTGTLITSFSNPQTGELDVDMIHYDKHLNEIWLMEEDVLTRYDINGVQTFTSAITPLEEFVLDGQGNIWASDDNTLYYISSSDSVLFQVIPFPGDVNEIEHLVVNPSDDSVWVANYYNIVNYSNQGIEQHRLNVLNKINGLAIYSDIYVPTLSLVSPEVNSVTKNAMPSFLFNLQDKGVGADVTTIELVSNNLIVPTTCVLDSVTDNSICTVNQTLTDGVWDFTATVKDYLANQSAPIAFTINIDTVAPTVTVNSHWNGAYVNQSAQAIGGLLSEISELDINGFRVTLGLNNSFSYPVLLIEEQNNFLITAKDQAGNVGTFPFVLFLDSIAPTAANVGSIVVADVVNGQTTVTGQAGAVEAGALVEVTNLTTNVVTTVQANADGSFSLTISASPADQLNIVIIDKANNRSAISAMQVPLPLAIEIISPADGDIIQGDTVNIEGIFKGPMNSGITVNGQPAEVSPNGSFVLSDLTLNAGINTLDIVLTTLAGQSITQSLSVTSDGQILPLKFEPNFNSGPAPLNIEFEFEWYSKEAILNIEVDYEGDGIVDYATNLEQESFVASYSLPGIYRPSITVTTALASYKKQTMVLVQSRDEMIQMFTSIWDGMNQALVKGDLPVALQYLNDYSKTRYAPVFEVLKIKMPQIIQSYSRPQGVKITANVGELAINRDYNGVNRIYFIYFMRNQNGLWKLHSM